MHEDYWFENLWIASGQQLCSYTRATVTLSNIRCVAKAGLISQEQAGGIITETNTIDFILAATAIQALILPARGDTLNVAGKPYQVIGFTNTGTANQYLKINTILKG